MKLPSADECCGFDRFQSEQVAVYLSVGLEPGSYFALLDKYLIEDAFYKSLGKRCLDKLCGEYGPIYRNVGELITETLDEIAHKCRLDDHERQKVEREISALGLSFGTDTSRWREYRSDKRTSFRLLPLDALNCRSRPATQWSRVRRQVPPSLHA